jgi:OmpA-OmpF porin, OOP family
MHKLVSTSVMAAALSITAAPAHAQSHFYLNGGVGKLKSQTDGNKASKGTTQQSSTSGITTRLMAGYRWNILPNLAIGPEFGYANLGRLSPSKGVPQAPSAGDKKRSVSVYMLGANAKWNITTQLYAMGRVGWAVTDALRFPRQLEPIQPGKRQKLGGNTTAGSYWGLGLGYDINRNWGVGIGYDNYSFSRSHKGVTKRLEGGVTTANVEYRF